MPAGLSVGVMIVSSLPANTTGVPIGQAAVDELLRVGRVGRQEDVGRRTLGDLRRERRGGVGRDRQGGPGYSRLVGDLDLVEGTLGQRRGAVDRQCGAGRRRRSDGRGRRRSRPRRRARRWRRAGARAGREGDGEDRRRPTRRDFMRALLGGRDLDDDVRGFHDADRLVADLETHVLDGLGGHEADHPVRTGDHLDDRRHPILLDAGDDAREPVSGGLRDDRSIGRRLAALIEEPADLVEVDHALAALGSLHPESSLGLPASQRLDRHTEHLGGLAHAKAPPGRSCVCVIPLSISAMRAHVSRVFRTCTQESAIGDTIGRPDTARRRRGLLRPSRRRYCPGVLTQGLTNGRSGRRIWAYRACQDLTGPQVCSGPCGRPGARTRRVAWSSAREGADLSVGVDCRGQEQAVGRRRRRRDRSP